MGNLKRSTVTILMLPVISVTSGSVSILVSRWLSFLAGYHPDPGAMVFVATVVDVVALIGWVFIRSEGM